MDLSKYIQEAISSGKHGAYGVRFPDKPTDKNVKEWLEYKGYPDLTKWEHPTQYILQKKFIGFYESYMNSASMFIGIVNGDGVKEYRLYFWKQSGNWNMVSITLVEIKGGKLNLREIEMNDQNMDDLKEWLDNGSGVREAISSGRSGYKRITDDEINDYRRTITEFCQYLEDNGFNELQYEVSTVNELFRKHGKEKCYTRLANGAAERVIANIPGKDTAVCDVYDIVFGKPKNVSAIYRLMHGLVKMQNCDFGTVIDYIKNA
jgi:hypothetical protein